MIFLGVQDEKNMNMHIYIKADVDTWIVETIPYQDSDLYTCTYMYMYIYI